MPAMMRELPTITLDDVRDGINLPGRLVHTFSDKIRLNLTSGDPHIEVRTMDGMIELPSAGVLEALPAVVKAPASFIKGLPTDLAESLMNSLLARGSFPVDIRATDISINEAYAPSVKRLEPEMIVDVVERVMPSDSRVVEWGRSSGKFHLDVVVDPASDRIFECPVEVGDISLGGLRIDQSSYKTPDIKQYWYRLICTNGATTTQSESVSMRADLDDLMSEMEDVMRRSFFSIHDTLEQFYALKAHRVDNVEQAVARWSSSVRDRSERLSLITGAPEYFHAIPEPTRFDVANYFTSQATDMSMPGPARWALEAAGGDIVEHHAICPTCQHLLN